MDNSERFATVSYSSPAVVGAFYIPGESCETKFQRDGVDWRATYHATFDGLGYLVHEGEFTIRLPLVLIEAIIGSMRVLGEHHDDDIRQIQTFVAAAGTPGVTHSFESLKEVRVHLRIIEQIFTPMLRALIPPTVPEPAAIP